MGAERHKALRFPGFCCITFLVLHNRLHNPQKIKSPVHYPAENSTKSLCRPLVSDAFNFSDNLVTLEGLEPPTDEGHTLNVFGLTPTTPRISFST
jgi:hypothetical protein